MILMPKFPKVAPISATWSRSAAARNRLADFAGRPLSTSSSGSHQVSKSKTKSRQFKVVTSSGLISWLRKNKVTLKLDFFIFFLSGRHHWEVIPFFQGTCAVGTCSSWETLTHVFFLSSFQRREIAELFHDEVQHFVADWPFWSTKSNVLRQFWFHISFGKIADTPLITSVINSIISEKRQWHTEFNFGETGSAGFFSEINQVTVMRGNHVRCNSKSSSSISEYFCGY